ncbi:MAG: SRPBCC domain-containing protein [Fimbriimonas sp.]
MKSIFIGLLTLSVVGAQAQKSAGAEPKVERAITLSTTVNATPAQAWRAWTTKEGLREFLGADAAIELRLGGRYEFLFDPSQPVGLQGGEGNQVLAYIPEKMLSFTWNAPPKFPDMRTQRTFVVVTFTPEGKGKTRIDLRQGGWKDGKSWDAVYDYFTNAWPMVLGACKSHFEKAHAPGNQASAVEPKPNTEKDMKPLDELSKMIGGVWRGEVKGPDGPMIVEFKYTRHRDGVGVVGSGVIGKGSKNALYVSSQFGWDPVAKAVYYLDSHDSETVYFGHITLDGNQMVFTFSPVGMIPQIFSSRSRLLDENTYQGIIRGDKGEELVGLTLKRERE